MVTHSIRFSCKANIRNSVQGDQPNTKECIDHEKEFKMLGKNRLPAPEEWLKETIAYKDGELFWTSHEANKKKNFKDRPIGENSNSKYKLIRLDGQNHLLHRVIYWLFTNEWPELVDHIDGDSHNNRIENLRASDYKLNRANTLSKGNIVEHPNLDGTTSYYVTLALGGMVHYVGSYKDRIDALYAVWRMRELLHPDFALFPKSTAAEQRAVCEKYQCSIRVRK